MKRKTAKPKSGTSKVDPRTRRRHDVDREGREYLAAFCRPFNAAMLRIALGAPPPDTKPWPPRPREVKPAADGWCWIPKSEGGKP